MSGRNLASTFLHVIEVQQMTTSVRMFIASNLIHCFALR